MLNIMDKNKNNEGNIGMLNKSYQKDMLETVNEILEMDFEIKNLKELLATEIKLKELMAKEIEELKNRLSNKKSVENDSDNKENINAANNVTNISQKQAKLIPAYEYSLINSLRNDQKDIMVIYNEVMACAEKKEYSLVTRLLQQLSDQIKEHYQYADKELYTYLKVFIQKKYPKREIAFTELCYEMKNTALQIFSYFNPNPDIPKNEESHKIFIEELEILGKRINRRIHREESVLFVMYEESNETTDNG